ncbi:hypothetical protein NIES4102_10670 [Chondrocystis sp. NIES-4102]|nr:hypothetical protein NIES4102_10670 [Chondrocystis sp. NIES-4102]
MTAPPQDEVYAYGSYANAVLGACIRVTEDRAASLIRARDAISF